MLLKLSQYVYFDRVKRLKNMNQRNCSVEFTDKLIHNQY
jgi:hypothetical protein